jgi:hypothetical protein
METKNSEKSKIENTSARKRINNIKWKPIFKEVAIISAKGIVAGFTYQMGMRLYEKSFFSLGDAQNFKLIEGGKINSRIA